MLNTIAFYKPYGVLCSFTDPQGRPTLKNYIHVPGVYAAGRLDFDSEGLLILTNDGRLAHHLTHPHRHQEKTYLVQVEGQITTQALNHLRQGVEIKSQRSRRCQVEQIDEPDLPARAKPITPHAATCWVKIILTEGKKRQIRHMTAAVGFPTLRIVRIAIGAVQIGGLMPGDWRMLGAEEIRALWSGGSARPLHR
jgi:23S rRNA pseudouridine2457 synthase